MKVIFLDFDGVLNSWRFFKKSIDKGIEARPPYHHVDPKAVAVLNRIIELSGAKVVVSSTWRIFHSPDRLQEILQTVGDFRGEIIDRTPQLNTYRGMEIAEWLATHEDVESFVIIDDEADMVHLKHKLVQTSIKKGLRKEHVPEILRHLGL